MKMTVENSNTTQKVAPNVGMFIDSSHNLWLDKATPNVEDAHTGNGLQPGEVTIAIKSTGICG